MANNQDARPFADLKKDAEEFQEKFDEDIKECINFLDAKITALICDPDSLTDPRNNVKQSAKVEFVKAKYDIFISVKNLINSKEREWLTYISEMKKLFVENVEIFLANTKLEVKLPSSEFQSSPGPRKSPGNRKSTSSITSSVFPIISGITKNIPVLTSPLQNKDASSNDVSNVGNKAQSNRSSRLSAKLQSPPSRITTISLNDNMDSYSDSSSNEMKGSGNVKISVYQNNDAEISSDSSEGRTVGNKVQTNKRGRQSTTSIKLASSQLLHEDTESMEVDDSGETDSGQENVVEQPKPVARGRRGKQPVQNTKLDDDNVSHQNSKKLTGRALRLKKAAEVKESNDISEETEQIESIEPTVNQVKGRRGRSTVRKGATNVLENQNTESASVVEEVEEPIVKVVTTKGRRGRAAALKNSDTISENQIANKAGAVEEKETTTEVVNTKGRRGRTAALKNSNDTISDKNITVRTPAARGRKSFKVVNEPAPPSNEDNAANSDDLSGSDLESPVARPTKPSARRKTLLPQLEDLSGADIIPGNPTRATSKRKTIGGVSELQSAAPAKRLKVGSRKNMPSVQEEDNAANDNLLESDDNYSGWMALKNVDGKIPTQPAIYEVKVWRAKKPAYIGFCESLRQKLTLYKLRQNSGHKHLDKFVERNYDDIQLRFEVVSSVNDAKGEVKNRINRFVDQYKTTPAYN